MEWIRRFITNWLKEVFASGSFPLWSGIFLIALVPAIFRAQTDAILQALPGNMTLPDWNYYLIAAISAAFLFSFRIALLTTPRIRLSTTPYESKGEQEDGLKYHTIYLGVKNISYKELDNCLAQIDRIEDANKSAGASTFPLVLQTEHRSERAGAASSAFHLRNCQSKQIKLLRYEKNNEKQTIKIYHEGSTPLIIPVTEIWRRPSIMTIGIYGGGAPVIQKYELFIEHDELVFRTAPRRIRICNFEIQLRRRS